MTRKQPWQQQWTRKQPWQQHDKENNHGNNMMMTKPWQQQQSSFLWCS
jgi:hypothetical protein